MDVLPRIGGEAAIDAQGRVANAPAMRIAYLCNAEAYQLYHGAPVAFALAEQPGVSVTTYYLDPTTPHHMERIRAAFAAPPQTLRALRQSRRTRLLKRVFGRFSLFKKTVLRENLEELSRYDVIVAQENSAAALRSMGMTRPCMVFLPHGFGDRSVSFMPRIRIFDLVLVAGPKTEQRMLEAGVIRPGHYALTGIVKFDTAARLGQSWTPPFDAERPIVLFNPHREPRLTSRFRFTEPLIEGFAQDRSMNLIVAPHVKVFHRRSQDVLDAFRARSTGNVLMDPGSDYSVDGTYPAVAQVYVGDISSQVYDYLDRPRPCVFLNAHGIDWKDDPNFANWHLGDVVDDPAKVMDAIRAAPARLDLYREAQERAIAATLGDTTPGAYRRAADAIMAFVAQGRV